MLFGITNHTVMTCQSHCNHDETELTARLKQSSPRTLPADTHSTRLDRYTEGLFFQTLITRVKREFLLLPAMLRK